MEFAEESLDEETQRHLATEGLHGEEGVKYDVTRDDPFVVSICVRVKSALWLE